MCGQPPRSRPQNRIADRADSVGPEQACFRGPINLEVRERRDGDRVVSARVKKKDTMLTSWMMLMTRPACDDVYDARDAQADIHRHVPDCVSY